MARRAAAVWLAALPALALAATTPAGAQMFVCTTASGKTITGDQPPPECRDRDIRELNHDGSTRRVIAAPLSREQRRRQDAEAQEKAIQEEHDLAQARRDRSLLETYGSLEEVEGAKRRALDSRRTLVERAEQRLQQYRRERKRLDDEAEFYARRELPVKLKNAYASNDNMIAQQEKIKSDNQAEMQRITERYDADARRYRELEALSAQAAAERTRAREAAEAAMGSR
jgi:hypothetical protein